MSLRNLLLIALLLVPQIAGAAPPSREVVERQMKRLAELTKSLEAETTPAGKLGKIAAALKGEKDVEMRRRLIDLAAAVGGSEREAFLMELVTTEEDSGLRSQIATALGKTGSEKCLPVLAKLAASDRMSTCVIGCIAGQSSARRAATFAIAELVDRYPKLFEEGIVQLKALPDKLDPKDNQSLGDARLQALYQISRDEKLLAPFYARLESLDPQERIRGVVAFQFLKLKKTPPQITQALQDSNEEVRSWAALVLGQIKDAKAVHELMEAAANEKEDRNLRANAIYSLGQLRAKEAQPMLEKLLGDPDYAALAAVALYRITGKKVKQFPEGYNAD